LKYRLRSADGVEVAVEGDRIVESRGRIDLTLDLAPGDLRPGLINAHDHLHRNHFPRLGRPPYIDAYEWGRDIHEKDADVIARARAVGRRDALLFGALKNLLSGVTSVVHHDAWEAAFEEDFPLRVLRIRSVHSLGTEGARAMAQPDDRTLPLCIHLAEGTTPAMAEEVREADRLGLLTDRLIAVHLVGVDPRGIDLLSRRGVTAAWCPTSNDFLFGRTAPPELLDRLHVVIGSDSMLTGAGTLLDELRHARSSRLLDDQRLLDGVGHIAASKLRVAGPALSVGARADIVLFARSPLVATCEDVQLVIAGGVPRVADERYSGLFEILGVSVERVCIGDSIKLVAAPLGDVAERILANWPAARRIFGSEPVLPPRSGSDL
jgi:cytosine/adenosine deaminase-related metal-dependent hydrolase